MRRRIKAFWLSFSDCFRRPFRDRFSMFDVVVLQIATVAGLHPAGGVWCASAILLGGALVSGWVVVSAAINE